MSWNWHLIYQVNYICPLGCILQAGEKVEEEIFDDIHLFWKYNIIKTLEGKYSIHPGITSQCPSNLKSFRNLVFYLTSDMWKAQVIQLGIMFSGDLVISFSCLKYLIEPVVGNEVCFLLTSSFHTELSLIISYMSSLAFCTDRWEFTGTDRESAGPL